MYPWIWAHLPGPWPVKTLLAVVLVVAVVLLLLTTVFPAVVQLLPGTDVSVE